MISVSGSPKQPLPIASLPSQGSYGDMVIVPKIPTVALNAVYNLLPANGRAYISGSGSVSQTGRKFKCSTGTGLNAYGTLQSFRALNHRNGAGVTIRCAGYFPDSVAATWTGIGAFSIGDEVSFGRNGTTFGVWHRYGGLPEVRTFTVTVAAAGAETATVTINDTEYSIPLTAGTTAHNAYEIATYLAANATGYEALQNGSTITVSAKSDGAKSGTWSLSSTGAATATVTQLTAGVAKTSDHYPQASWSGSVFSTFDPSLGNNYQIKYNNGYGVIKYYVQNPSGDWDLVHEVSFPSTGTDENFGNPSLHVGAYAASVGSTTDCSVYCGFVAASVNVQNEKTRNPRGFDYTKSISTTETNLLTLRCRRNYNGMTNQSEIEPLVLTLANDGTKSAIFYLRTNPTVGGEPDFANAGTNLISEVDVAGTTVTGGTLIAPFTVAKGQSITVDLTAFEIAVPPTLRLTVSAKMASGAAADLTAALAWYENI